LKPQSKSHRPKAQLLFAVCIAFSTATAQIPQTEYGQRRTALASAVRDGIVVALGAPEPVEDYIAFNQSSSFKYLTGFEEPGATLVMIVKNGAISGTPLLFRSAE
jgi:Aminopeptidase P, N-terminal domain.